MEEEGKRKKDHASKNINTYRGCFLIDECAHVLVTFHHIDEVAFIYKHQFMLCY